MRLWSTPRATLGNQLRFGLIVLAAVAIAPSMTQAGSLSDQVSHERFTVVKVDTDADEPLSEKYHVRTIPTIVAFKSGQEVRRAVNPQSRGALDALVEG